jgi:hypothetical protein
MTFDVPADLTLFAESVRTAIGDWQPPREPDLGCLATIAAAGSPRLATPGGQLWAGGLLGYVVAGSVELGRRLRP